MSSDSDDGNGGWILILFLILFLGPCQATERNESKIEDLEGENRRLEQRVEELEKWKDSR